MLPDHPADPPFEPNDVRRLLDGYTAPGRVRRLPFSPATAAWLATALGRGVVATPVSASRTLTVLLSLLLAAHAADESQSPANGGLSG